MKTIRPRQAYLILGSFIVLLLWVISDPDFRLIENLPFGAGTVAMILYSFKSIILCAILHISRKFLFDYPEADFQKLGSIAKNEPMGAGLYAIAISLSTIAFAIVIAAAVLSD